MRHCYAQTEYTGVIIMAPVMKFIFLNIKDGAAEEPARLARVTDWLRSQDADVLALCELNGWQQAGVFEKRQAAMGYPFGHIMHPGPSAYRVGVLARQYFAVRHEVTSGVAHGILQVGFESFDLLVSHFAPFDAKQRLFEAEQCVGLMESRDRPSLLVGDLNSHSPADRVLCEAFVTPENRDWAFDYSVHQKLLDAGLVDLGQAQAERWSTATAMNPDEPRRRLDFAYANAAFMAEHSDALAQVIRDEVTAELSDHYPLVVRWG